MRFLIDLAGKWGTGLNPDFASSIALLATSLKSLPGRRVIYISFTLGRVDKSVLMVISKEKFIVSGYISGRGGMSRDID